MHDIYLLLGSNLGDRKAYLSDACAHIEEEIGPIEGKSSLYETASWGKINEPAYINQVVYLRSILEPQQVLKIIISIEKKLGRERAEKWGSRIIDIDILFCDHQVINEPDLIIPHPHLHERRFTLAPLNELIPDFVHPLLEKTINDLYCGLKDNLAVTQIKN
jgi:2-amino-4-hydroxy-6-hydroxymethyldihydropteridine diphosphokinase